MVSQSPWDFKFSYCGVFFVRFGTQLERYILKQPHQSQSFTLSLWHFEIRHWLWEFYFHVIFNFKYSLLCHLFEAKRQLLIRNITGRWMLLSPFNIQNMHCFKTKLETKPRHLRHAMKWHQYVIKQPLNSTYIWRQSIAPFFLSLYMHPNTYVGCPMYHTTNALYHWGYSR